MHAVPPANSFFRESSHRQVAAESGKGWCKRSTGLCCNSAVSALPSKRTGLFLQCGAWRANRRRANQTEVKKCCLYPPLSAKLIVAVSARSETLCYDAQHGTLEAKWY